MEPYPLPEIEPYGWDIGGGNEREDCDLRNHMRRTFLEMLSAGRWKLGATGIVGVPQPNASCAHAATRGVGAVVRER
jgi:hypothetical protein